MELLQLRYFYESAKNENFSQTAKLFTVPTTSVSAAIKRLEQELGCQLFDRTSNKIRLNSRGKQLQQTLCTVFHELDQTVEQLSVQIQDKRQIKILVRSMRRKITHYVIQYSKLHPDFSFQIIFDQGEKDFQNYDIIIDDEKDHYSGYERIELFNLRLRLKCSADHPLLGQELQLRQLANYPFVFMNTNSNTHKILTDACHRVGFSPRDVVHCNDIDCYERFVAAGTGIGILRQDDGHDRSSHHICELNVLDFDPSYTIYAYYSQTEYYGNLRDFLAFLKSHTQE